MLLLQVIEEYVFEVSIFCLPSLFYDRFIPLILKLFSTKTVKERSIEQRISVHVRFERG
jgi:hypothetical protein